MATRADPFAEADDPLDVNDFELAAKKAARKPVDTDDLASFARATGFDRSIEPSPRVTEPPQLTASAPGASRQRRYRTGRDTQLNIKSKPETKARFLALADRKAVSLGELFEMMLDRFDKPEQPS